MSQQSTAFQQKPGGAQSAPGSERPSDEPQELREAAREQVRQRAEALRRFPLPITAEPAFVFRP
jgi:hypothetical protein